MAKKTILHRLFGVGRIPRRLRSELDSERILLLDEGIGGSITYRKFRAPGKRFALRRTWFTGSLAVTEARVTGFAYTRQVLNVPRKHPRIADISVRIEPSSVLCISFDAEKFHADQSGRIELRFRTEKAIAFASFFGNAV